MIAQPETLRETIEALAESGATVALTWRMILRLADELTGTADAIGWAGELADRIGRPVAVNVPRDESDPDGASTTFCFPPDGWSEQRLGCWVDEHREVFTEAFGRVERVYRHEARS